MTTTKTLNRLRSAKKVARKKYAWPGGYALHLVMDDGECLCAKCVRENWRQVVRATLAGVKDGWRAVGADVNWEDDMLSCAHCNEQIKTEYLGGV